MLYSKRDFAALTNQKTNNLAKYIQRGQVIVGDDGLIDSDEDLNELFMAKHCGISDDADEPVPAKASARKKKISYTGPTPEFADGWMGEADSDGAPIIVPERDRPGKNGIPKISDSEKAFKHWQAEKYRIDGQLRELEFQKKTGSLIPTELMGSVIAQQAKSFSSAFRQALARMTDLMSVKYKLTGQDLADMRKMVVETTNKAISDGLEESRRQVKAIAHEFTEKKKIDLEL